MNTTQGNEKQALVQLRVQFVWVVLVAIGLLAAGVWGLYQVGSPVPPLRWALLAGFVLSLELLLLWRNLPHNHRPAEPDDLLTSFGPGTVLTLLRGLCIGLVAGFLFSSRPEGWIGWAPAVLYTVGGIADWFDGTVARLANHSTRLGETLDMEYDALGVLIVPLLGVWHGQLPPWYLLVSALRYLYVLHLRIRGRRRLPVRDLPPDSLRRVLAGFQMGFIGVALLPLFRPPVTWLAATVFMIPFVAGFIRDWLVAITVLDPSSVRYRVLGEWLHRVFRIGLPVGLRGVTTLALAALAITALWRDTPILASGAILVGVLLLPGVLSRVVSLAGLLGTGLYASHSGLDGLSAMIIVGAIVILLFGPGRWALWAPEERFVMWRGGEPFPRRAG